MAVKTIVTPPHESLKTVASEVSLTDKSLWAICCDLVDTLQAQSEPAGVGLSAPQIAKSKRVFVARVSDSEDGPLQLFVNPKYASVSEALTSKKESYQRLEGCLSLPDLYGVVLRHVWVEMRYWTLSVACEDIASMDADEFLELLEEKTETYDGFMSRVIQHEYDHLDGILFTQRVLQQGGTLYEVGEDERGKDVLYEVEM